jgi:hypothetical protein
MMLDLLDRLECCLFDSTTLLRDAAQGSGGMDWGVARNRGETKTSEASEKILLGLFGMPARDSRGALEERSGVEWS